MKKITLLLFWLVAIGYSQNPETNNTANWTVTKLANTNQLVTNPYDIEEGPDGWLWITERRTQTINSTPLTGERLVRINPSTGAKTVMIDLNSRVYATAGQDGLMGMAVHPALFANPTTTVNNYVYLAYTYFVSGGANDGRFTRISRFSYNHTNATLDPLSELTIIEGLDGSNDHNSGKLAINPIDMKLYYSHGDLGWNQFTNKCKVIQSQALPSQADVNADNFYSYKGKMLRMNLDGTIPGDNPLFAPFVPTATNPGPPDNSIADNLKVRSHIYSFGHRNAQGIVFAPDGTMYSSEHGDVVDDELNIIQAGKNYGWPLVAGYYDNAGYDYCIKASAPGCSTANNDCPAGATVHQESAFPQPFDFVAPVATYDSTVAPNASTPSGGFLTWPTVAPSGIAYYASNNAANVIPWAKSLLIPTLKKGTIYRYELNAAGDQVTSNLIEFHSTVDRYRDVIVSRDGTTIYAITDSSGQTSGPSGSGNLGVTNPGAVYKITYTPAAQPANQVTNFSATGSTGKITLNWTDATAGSAPAGGYLIKASTTSFASLTDPIDGDMPATDANLADGEALVYVNTGVQNFEFTGLDSAVPHYFKIWSFSNTGSAVNYRNNSTRTATATPVVLPKLLLSEVVSYSGTDASLGARNQMNFVEIYNYGSTAIDLATAGVHLVRERAGTNPVERFNLALSGTLQPKSYFIIGKSTYNAQAAFYAPGTTANQIGSNDLLGGDGDDPYLLAVNFTDLQNFDTLDILGELGVDGNNPSQPWEYTDKRFYRNRFVTSNAVFTASEWRNQTIIPAVMLVTPGKGDVEDFIYDNGMWTPADPSGVSLAGDTVTVINGSPVLTGNLTTGLLTINSGDSLDLNGNDLIIAGDGFMNINGTLLGANSTLRVHAGSRVNHRQGNTPLTFKNIDLSQSTLPNLLDRTPVTITGVLSMNNQQLSVTNLILKSTATGTAMIGQIPSGGSISASVGVTSERYIPAKRAFRFMSSPVTTTSTIYDNWQEGGAVVAGRGTHITGSTTGANGFDTTATGGKSLFTFNNSTQLWTAPTNTNVATLTAGNPYRLYVRGDRTVSLNSNTATPTNTTLRMTGDIVVGATQATGLSAVAGGFNFVGNPYQAPVDMQQVLAASTNLNPNFLYFWDATLNAQGGYVTVTVPTNNSTPSSRYNKFAQPHTSFFVSTLANGAVTMTFQESHKNVNEEALNIFSTPNAPGSLQVQLFDAASHANGDRELDATMVLLSSTGNNNIDAMDAVKFGNIDESLSVSSNGSLLSIEDRGMVQDGDFIQLNAVNYRQSSYVLQVAANGFNLPAYIYDALDQSYTPLAGGNGSYAFTVDPSNTASTAVNRFQIKLSTVTLSSGDVLANSNIRVYPNPTTDRVINIAGLESQEDVRLFSLIGQEIALNNVSQFNGQTLRINLPPTIARGTYLLKIGSDNNAIVEKIIVE